VRLRCVGLCTDHEAMHQLHLRHVFCALILGRAFVSAPVWASPPDSVWIEDTRLHPSGPAELSMIYDFIEPDTDIDGASIDVITLSTLSGFDRAPMDFQPSIGFVQAGLGSVRLEHVGLRARYRVRGTTSQPSLAVVLGYRVQLFGEHNHDFEQALAGRVPLGTSLSLGYELRLRELVGDGGDVEARIGASLGTTTAIGLVRVNLESFALLPIRGQRLTDYGAGGNPDAPALYVGPSLRVSFEYFWFDLSAVTGRILPDGADVMVRTTLGTQF
jgi:hypothetical protein